VVGGLDRFLRGRRGGEAGGAGCGVRGKAIRSLRLRLHSGLRQSGKKPYLVAFPLGLRPRLVYVGPLAL